MSSGDLKDVETQTNEANNSNDRDSSANGSTNVVSSPAKLESPASVSSSVSPVSVSSSASPQKDSDASSNTSFENLSSEEAIKDNTLSEVMHKMATKHHDISVDQEPLIYGKCKTLFSKDYMCEVVDNLNYCMNYPIGIIVPLANQNDLDGTDMKFDVKAYTKLVEGAPEARLRSRFVAPVILFDNKYVCRSGTLTVKLSGWYAKCVKPAKPQTITYPGDDCESYGLLGLAQKTLDAMRNMGTYAYDSLVIAYESITKLIDWDAMKTPFETDVQILELLKVDRVFDLMVEYEKLYKQTISVSSTEKLHKDLYKNVKMQEMPFPGCEFFTRYYKADRNPKKLFFDWKQVDVTRELDLTENPNTYFPEINVAEQREWDLTLLTQNYLKIMISQILTGTGGVVIHCISGWDRTPLFVSLLRLSLWADGVIHESLDYKDIAYLTVAYDWFLFGHNLPNRVQKKEEVMHFCFNFVEHITSDEFSVTKLFESLPEEQKRGRVFPEFVPGRRSILNKIRTLVLKSYNKEITY